MSWLRVLLEPRLEVGSMAPGDRPEAGTSTLEIEDDIEDDHEERYQF